MLGSSKGDDTLKEVIVLTRGQSPCEHGLSADDRDTLRYSVAKGWNMLY